MSSPPYRGQITSHIFETHNVTSTCRNNLVWQTRQQRSKHDMATKVSKYEDFNSRRLEREEKKRRKAHDDERTSRYDGSGYSEFYDLRKKLDSKKRKKRIDDNWMSTRSRSYSRVRSVQSRGRSRSPRISGAPGPSILKKRSQSAHGGRWRGETIASGKMFRISAVDQVYEYSPYSDVVDDGCVTEEEEEELVSKSVKDDMGSAPSISEMTRSTKKSLNSREMVLTEKKTAAIPDSKNSSNKYCRSIIKSKAPAGEGPLNLENGGDDTSEDLLDLQSKYDIPSVDITELSEVDSSGKTLLNAEDSSVEATQNHEKTKAGGTVPQDYNLNDFLGEEFHGFDSDDINDNYLSEEEDFHGYDMKDSDFKDDNISVEHRYNGNDQKWDGRLTIVFSGGYQTRQVSCQHKDCLMKSTPSTIGLLPFSTKTGQEWLCPDHMKCLLCPDPVDTTNSASVKCARVFHTSHLQDLGIEEEDMKELVCKLCSDPGHFTVTTSGKLTKCDTSSRREIMTTDHSLPSGWSRQIVTNSVNKKRVVITGPDGRRYWDRRGLEKTFKDKDDSVEWKSFSFSVYTSSKK